MRDLENKNTILPFYNLGFIEKYGNFQRKTK